jgi:hypothetical protein
MERRKNHMEVASVLLVVAVGAILVAVAFLFQTARAFSASARLQKETLDAVLALAKRPDETPQTTPGPVDSQLGGNAPLPPVDSKTIPDLMVRYATEVASLMDLTAWIATWLSDAQLKLLQLVMETPGLMTEFLPNSEITNLAFLAKAGLIVEDESGHAIVPAPFHEPIRRVARARGGLK